MKRLYEEPELDLTHFNFENILYEQNLSDPEHFERSGYEFDGEL